MPDLSCLTAAAEEGRKDLVDYLLNIGADPNLLDNKNRFVHLEKSIIEYLIFN